MSYKYFDKTITIQSASVNIRRVLRTSSLLRMLQELTIAFTEAEGVTRRETLDRGLLWVIAKQAFDIKRIPAYDETITLRCYALPTMHMFFPRYYEVYAGEAPALNSEGLSPVGAGKISGTPAAAGASGSAAAGASGPAATGASGPAAAGASGPAAAGPEAAASHENSSDSTTPQPIITGTTLWLLMDETKRSMVLPEVYGIHLDGGDSPAGFDIPKMISMPKEEDGISEKLVTAPFSFADINGHINNAHYFDIAEDAIPFEEVKLLEPAGFEAEYEKEILPGDKVRLTYMKAADGWYFRGTFADDGKDAFRIHIRI